MKQLIQKDIKNKMDEKEQTENYRYLDEKVKNFEFADWVRVQCNPLGMLFSFGKSHPEKQEFIIFSEILLPIHTAHSLQQIIMKQLEELQKKGFIKIEIKDEGKNG
ncbi:MAG: hypothetical protein NTV06_07180 [candidate division Zixibacteria bacterium]|nr:hypothetical protein [candidate division Zixibacteria bacterium]